MLLFFLRIVNIVFISFYIGFLIGCSTIYDISYDYDRAADFTILRSYNWLPVPEESYMNSLDLIRIKKAVSAVLNDKGFKKALNNPDFLIASHWGTKDIINVRPWGYGYGSYGRYWGGYWGYGGVSVYQYEEGTLLIDFVEPDSKNLFWRGAAKREVDNTATPEKRDKMINDAVQKILKNFPPIKLE
jgi:hypothetical protein